MNRYKLLFVEGPFSNAGTTALFPVMCFVLCKKNKWTLTKKFVDNFCEISKVALIAKTRNRTLCTNKNRASEMHACGRHTHGGHSKSVDVNGCQDEDVAAVRGLHIIGACVVFWCHNSSAWLAHRQDVIYGPRCQLHATSELKRQKSKFVVYIYTHIYVYI